MDSSFHIIGDQDTVLGYGFAGVTGDAVDNAADARAAFRRRIASGEPGILLLTEKVESMISDEVREHRLSAQPPYLAIVRDIWGRAGTRPSLEAMIAEAVGIRI